VLKAVPITLLSAPQRISAPTQISATFPRLWKHQRPSLANMPAPLDRRRDDLREPYPEPVTDVLGDPAIVARVIPVPGLDIDEVAGERSGGP